MAAPSRAGGPPDWESPTASVPAWAPPNLEELEGHLAALSQIRKAALLSVVSAALGISVSLVFSWTGYHALSVTSTGTGLTTPGNALNFLVLEVFIGLALSIVSFWFYRDGFLALRTLDERFRWSAAYAWLAILGGVIVGLGLLLVLVVLFPCITTYGMSWPSCFSFIPVTSGLVILAVGLIVFLIGYIGTLVAIWRLGARYRESLFNIGAVLALFPFLNVLGEVLVFVAASRAESKVRQSTASARNGAPTSP
jgi:uncharacterized membrane protein